MTTMNPLADIDAKAAVGGPALKPRAGGNGRHHGKIPDMFPAVLADFTLSKNVALEAFSAVNASGKIKSGDAGAADADRKEASPDEEAVLQPAIPADMKQYLQNMAAVGQMQAAREETAIAPESVDELLSTVASKGETKAKGTPEDGESANDIPENIENFGTPGNPQVKPVTPQEPNIELTKNYQGSSTFAGDSSIKDTQIAEGVTVDDSIKSARVSLEFSVDGNVRKSQALPGYVTGDNTKRPPIQTAPRDVKSIGPTEPDSKTAGPPRALSAELSKLENLADPKEVKQAKLAEAELRVIKVETSFSPTASSAFVQQFSKVITDALEGQAKAVVAVAAIPVSDPRPDVVRSIQIRLHPDDLGKIKVAMHLRGEELRLQIEVTSRKVEVLLQNDQQVLKDLLGQSGYDIKDASISITVSPNDLNPPQRSNAASESSSQSLVGQGGRQHPGTGEENQNPFQKARGSHAFAAEYESDQKARLPTAGSRRGSGVFV